MRKDLIWFSKRDVPILSAALSGDENRLLRNAPQRRLMGAAPAVAPHDLQTRPSSHGPTSSLNAILNIFKGGIPWRRLPVEFAPWKTIYWIFRKWTLDRAWETLNDRLRALNQEQQDKDPSESGGQSSQAIGRCQRIQSVPQALDASFAAALSGSNLQNFGWIHNNALI